MDEPYIEQDSNVAATVGEALATDYDGTLRFAPAAPPGWDAAGTVAIQGGSKADVQVEGGTVVTAAIQAGSTTTLTVRNPWPGRQAEVVDGASGASVVAPTTAATFGVPVTAGSTYLVEQVSAPTTSLPFAPVTGAAARSYRQLGGVSIGLGGNSLPAGDTVTVADPGNQTGTVGTPITGLQIQASDSAAGQPLTYSAAGLPSGLSISSSGLISGTPEAAGSSVVTVTVKDPTGASGSASFSWSVSGGGTVGGVHVDYTRTSEWAGGFTANITITNNGTTAINGWTVAWNFPGDQKITNAWNATATETGAAASATNVAYNAAVPPGGNVQFGFQGTYTSNDSPPTSFMVNGTPSS